MEAWLEELRPYAGEPRGSAGWRLAKAGWELVRRQGAIVRLALLLAVAWTALVYFAAGAGLAGSGSGIAGVVVFDALMALAGVFLLGAIVAAVDAALDGVQLTAAEALAEARESARPLLRWVALMLLVWVVLTLLSGGGRRPALFWLQFFWYLATFFVIPLAMLGGLDPGAGLRESLGILRRRRRESFAAILGIGFFGLLAMAPGLMVLVHGAAVHQEHGHPERLLLVVGLLLTFVGLALAIATKESFAAMIVRDEVGDLSPREHAGRRLARSAKVIRFCVGAAAVFFVCALIGAITKHDRNVLHESSKPGNNYTTVISNAGIDLPSGSAVLYQGLKVGEVLGSEQEGLLLRVRFHVEPGYSPETTPGELTVQNSAGESSLVIRPAGEITPGSPQL